MRVWKTAVAGSLAAAVMAGGIQQAAAAPLPTNVATMKAAVGDDVTQVHWRGRGFGWGLGGLAAGAIIAGAIASSAPYGYGYYGGGPYYGGYGYPGSLWLCAGLLRLWSGLCLSALLSALPPVFRPSLRLLPAVLPALSPRVLVIDQTGGPARRRATTLKRFEGR